MKILINLAYQSLLSRKITVFLTIISLTVSIVLFLSIDTLRLGAKKSFFGNVKSGDIILGSRSGEIQLLLYSLFQIGSPTNNISWESFQEISKKPEIDWIIPISLGDSHKQFRVMGTTKEYFDRFSYRKNQKLKYQEGTYFENTFDVVIGNDVAKMLNYKLEDSIIIAHGIASQSLHDEFPFKIKGILNKTGTSIDRLVLVSLEALEAIHKDWKTGSKIPTKINSKKNYTEQDLIPKEITAAIIKLKSPITIFKIQREINDYEFEPLQAIIPGIVLTKLWQVVSVTENIMLSISAMVIVSALIGLIAILYSTLNNRRKEMALLRIVGASPKTIFSLLLIEALIISFLSIIIAILFSQFLNLILFPILDQKFGIYLENKFLLLKDLYFFVIILFTSVFVSIFPALQAYKNSINDGI
ncbi:MAG: peptide ABC transporter permease [Pelagibacterales bacterium]|nr:peptide ABC transporter permease [Pelagibacterales bacterium]